MSSPLWERTRVAIRDRDADTLASIAKEITGAKLPEGVENAILAQLEMGRGEDAAAHRRLVGASKKRPLVPQEKLVLGFLMIDKEPAKAKKLFTEATKGKLDDPRIPEGLGITAADRGYDDDAIRLLSRAVAADEKSWSARYALGMAKAKKGDAAGARVDFEAVCKMRPEYEPAWLGFAAMAIQSGQAAQASQVLGSLVKATRAQRPKIYYAYVDCLAAAGDYAKACAVITPVANASRDPELLFDYVELCVRGRFLEPALKTLRKIDKIKPKLPRTWVLRGTVFEMSEPPMVEDAITAYRTALQFDSEYGRAKNALALLLMRKNEHTNFDEAAKLLSAAAKDKKDPASATALSNLALLRLTEGKDDAAKRLAEAVLTRKNLPPNARAQAEKILRDVG